MPRARVEKIGPFIAVDAQGNKTTIHGTKMFKLRTDLSGKAEWVPAGASLKTAAGRPVNRIGKGEYEIVLPSGTIVVMSNDPTAP